MHAASLRFIVVFAPPIVIAECCDTFSHFFIFFLIMSTGYSFSRYSRLLLNYKLHSMTAAITLEILCILFVVN